MYDNVFLQVQRITEAPRIYPGGICDIFFTPIENVLTWPEVDPLTGFITGNIALKPGSFIYAADFNHETKEFSEETKDSSAGHYHDKSIVATLPGNVAANILDLGTLKFHKLLVIFKDKSGHYRFIGDEDSGAKIDYKYTSGDGDSSRNRDIKIIWSSQHPAPVYQGELPEASEAGLYLITDDGQAILTDDDQKISA